MQNINGAARPFARRAPMKARDTGFIALVLRYFGNLRFPYLVAVTASLFVLDLLIPDFVPFADEILLGLVTLVLARMKRL